MKLPVSLIHDGAYHQVLGWGKRTWARLVLLLTRPSQETGALVVDQKNEFTVTLQVSRMQDGNPVTGYEIIAAITGSRASVCIAGAPAIGSSTSGRSAYRGDLSKIVFIVYTAVKPLVLPFVPSFSHYCLLATLLPVVVTSSAVGLTWN